MSGELRKLRTLMRPKHPRDRLLALNASGVHDLMGSCISAEQPGSYEINRSYVEAFGSWHETDLPGAAWPVWSAVWAGIAVILWGDLYPTPAGGRYLASEAH
jgi:hypothetical protein